MNDKSYTTFGYDIEYQNVCNQCKTVRKRTGNSTTSDNIIINVPLPNRPHLKKGVSVKKQLTEMYGTSQVNDYICENCNSKDCTMTSTESITRFPKVLILSFQRKLYEIGKINKTR